MPGVFLMPSKQAFRVALHKKGAVPFADAIKSFNTPRFSGVFQTGTFSAFVTSGPEGTLIKQRP
jgi:hypothetical protein